jgi:hypothetical protein
MTSADPWTVRDRDARADLVRGPRDCLRTRKVSAPCDVCGARPEVMHVPMHGRGFRCSEHCENCQPAATVRLCEEKARGNG